MLRVKRSLAGVSVIEVVVAVTILAVIGIALMRNLTSQRYKGDDARIQSDLHRLKIVFEDYYSDHKCYPTNDMIANCGSLPAGHALKPYIGGIPCHPVTNAPYRVWTEGSCSRWFRLFGDSRGVAKATNPTTQEQFSAQVPEEYQDFDFCSSSTNTNCMIYPPEGWGCCVGQSNTNPLNQCGPTCTHFVPEERKSECTNADSICHP